MHLNHLEPCPPPPNLPRAMEKLCLPQNWSLVSKRLGTTVLLDWTISVRQVPYLVTVISSKSYTRAQITVKIQCMMVG